MVYSLTSLPAIVKKEVPPVASPCAGLRRLQGLTVKYCPCPSVHGPLPPLRGPPSPCAGTAARIAALVVLSKGKSPSGGMYSAWRRTAIARGNTCRGRGCISGALAPGVKKGFFPCQLPGERTSFKQRAFRTFVRLHSKGKIPLANRLRGALRSRPRLPHLAVR